MNNDRKNSDENSEHSSSKAPVNGSIDILIVTYVPRLFFN